ncbi:HK97 family phage prohead protease [Plantactinospora sonchi]|uniref:HK97 family phage prohead protease n=1 Tax=Plantactinospora sonchi TaxID=1544735 RepID=A0ABU7RNA1_9ACTN
MTLENNDSRALEEWHEQDRAERITTIRRRAKQLFGKSFLLNNIGDREAEQIARQLLSTAASAFWNSEDTTFEELAHEELDQYGRWVRETFGCRLAFEDGVYYQRCPVAIAHKRVGMSIGFTARQTVCSICGDDISECDHRSNLLYEVQGGVGSSGYCPVCGGSECDEHSPQKTYKVAPIRIIIKADLHEVSVVRKPANPDARITSIPVDTSNLKEVLGASFQIGDAVNCDRCLNQCRGIEEIDSLR